MLHRLALDKQEGVGSYCIFICPSWRCLPARSVSIRNVTAAVATAKGKPLRNMEMKIWNLIQKLHSFNHSFFLSLQWISRALSLSVLCRGGDVFIISTFLMVCGSTGSWARVCALSLYPFPCRRVLCRMAEVEQGVCNKKLILHFSRIFCRDAVPSE